MKVTLSYEAAVELYKRLQAYDSTLDLGFNDVGSRAFEELRKELIRCKREIELTQKMESLSSSLEKEQQR